MFTVIMVTGFIVLIIFTLLFLRAISLELTKNVASSMSEGIVYPHEERTTKRTAGWGTLDSMSDLDDNSKYGWANRDNWK